MLLLLTCILLGKREKLLEVPYGGCKVKCRIVLLCLHPTQECYILCEENHLEPIFPCSLQCYFHVHLCRPIVCTFSPVVHENKLQKNPEGKTTKKRGGIKKCRLAKCAFSEYVSKNTNQETMSAKFLDKRHEIDTSIPALFVVKGNFVLLWR